MIGSKKVVKPGCLAPEHRDESNYTLLTLFFSGLVGTFFFNVRTFQPLTTNSKAKTNKQNKTHNSINAKMPSNNLVSHFLWGEERVYDRFFITKILNQSNKSKMLMEWKDCCCSATTTQSSLNRLRDDGCKPGHALHPHCVTRAAALFRRWLTLHLSARQFHWPATYFLQETVRSPAIQSWQGITGNEAKQTCKEFWKVYFVAFWTNQAVHPILTPAKLANRAGEFFFSFSLNICLYFKKCRTNATKIFFALTSSSDGSDGLRTRRLFSLFHHHTKPRLIKQVWRHGNRVRSD